MEPRLPELLGPGSDEKHCAVCGIVKPRTAFYFHKDATTDDGWNPKCKECRQKSRAVKENREIATNIAKVQENLLRNIAAGGGKESMPDIVSGGETMLDAFGGMTGLAQKMAADYEAAAIGTAGRTKLLLGALQFIAKAMEQRQPVDVSSLSTEDLRHALKDALGDEYRRLTSESEDGPPVVVAE